MKVRVLAPLARRLYLSGLFLVALSGWQCEGRKSALQPPQQETGSIAVALVWPQIQVRAGSGKITLTQGRFRLAGEGMATRDTTVAVSGNRIAVVFDAVPVGLRSLSLDLLDAANAPFWRGDTNVQVQANIQATAVLQMEPVDDQAPTAVIAIDPEAGLPGATFSFAAQQVDDLHDGDEDLQTRWDFDNDGTFEIEWGDERTAQYTYPEEGNYTLALQVRDSSDKVGTFNKRVQVLDLRAQIGPTPGPDTLVVPLADNIKLDGTPSKGPPGGLVYNWSQVTNHPDHPEAKGSVLATLTDNRETTADSVFFNPRLGRGLYIFTLQVEDPLTNLKSGLDTLYVIVQGTAPVAQIVDPPGQVEVDQTVRLQGRASDDDDDDLVFRWRGEWADQLSDSTSVSPTFVPPAPDSYSFWLVAIDEENLESAPVEVVVEAVAPAPVAVFAASPTIGPAPLTVRFTNNSLNDDSFLWIVDGDIALDERNPEYTFESPGPHEVVLRAQAADERFDEARQTITVTDEREEFDLMVENLFLVDADGRQVLSDQVSEGDEVALRVLLFNGGTVAVDFALHFFLDDGDGPIQVVDNLDLEPQMSLVQDSNLWPAQAGAHGLGARAVTPDGGASESNLDNNSAGLSLQVNARPVASAGSDIEAVTGELVRLEGRGDDEDGDSDFLDYFWRQEGGPDVELGNAQTSSPRFIPPEANTYRFVLIVSDRLAESEPATVVVRVEDPDDSLPELLFTDPAVERAVRDNIQKDFGPIRPTDVAALTILDVSASHVANLDGLENLSALEELYLSDNQIENIAPLAQLENLKVLNLGENQIGNIEPLAGLTGLQSLQLKANPIEDIAHLAGLTELVILDLDETGRIGNIEPLAGLTKLQNLGLGDNQIEDITPLANLKGLQGLWLWDNGIANIEPLANLTELVVLDLGGNLITDISPLSRLTQLFNLNLANNPIDNFEPLASLVELSHLDLMGTGLQDLDPLAGLDNLAWINLADNEIESLRPLVENDSIGADVQIILSGNQLTSRAAINQLRALLDRGVSIILPDFGLGDLADLVGLDG